jgi:hypothetical protein
MFLGKEYILGNEISEKLNIHIANISILAKLLEDTDDVKQYGNCTFIKATSKNLPNNIKEGIRNHKFTDFTGILPLSYFLKEFELNAKQLEKSKITKEIFDMKFESKKSKTESNSIKKTFIKFTDEFINEVKGKVLYSLPKNELQENLQYIDGHIEIGTKVLVWY